MRSQPCRYCARPPAIFFPLSRPMDRTSSLRLGLCRLFLLSTGARPSPQLPCGFSLFFLPLEGPSSGLRDNTLRIQRAVPFFPFSPYTDASASLFFCPPDSMGLLSKLYSVPSFFPKMTSVSFRYLLVNSDFFFLCAMPFGRVA